MRRSVRSAMARAVARASSTIAAASRVARSTSSCAARSASSTRLIAASTAVSVDEGVAIDSFAARSAMSSVGTGSVRDASARSIAAYDAMINAVPASATHAPAIRKRLASSRARRRDPGSVQQARRRQEPGGIDPRRSHRGQFACHANGHGTSRTRPRPSCPPRAEAESRTPPAIPVRAPRPRCPIRRTGSGIPAMRNEGAAAHDRNECQRHGPHRAATRLGRPESDGEHGEQ